MIPWNNQKLNHHCKSSCNTLIFELVATWSLSVLTAVSSQLETFEGLLVLLDQLGLFLGAWDPTTIESFALMVQEELLLRDLT